MDVQGSECWVSEVGWISRDSSFRRLLPSPVMVVSSPDQVDSGFLGTDPN